MEIRRRFAYGCQHDYLDEASLAGWTREGDEAREGSGVAVVLCSQDLTQEQADPEAQEDEAPEPVEVPEKIMYVGKSHAGEIWRSVLGDVAEVTIDDEGMGSFPASVSSMVSVYLPEDAAARIDHIPIVRVRK
jgi:alpha-amylase